MVCLAEISFRWTEASSYYFLDKEGWIYWNAIRFSTYTNKKIHTYKKNNLKKGIIEKVLFAMSFCTLFILKQRGDI